MSHKYQINELADILGISRTAVNRKITKYGFNTVQEYVNGRSLKLIIVSDKQLSDLKHEVGHSKQVNTVSPQFTTQDVNISQHDNTVSEQAEMLSGSEKLITQVINLAETVTKQSETVHQYVNRVINAEKKVLLLEDIESRQKADFMELTAKVKELTEKNIQLEQDNIRLKEELQKKAWWKLGARK